MWQRVSRENPCYGCGKPDYCRWSEEGGVECKRGPFPGAKECRDKNGATHWVGSRSSEDWKPPERRLKGKDRAPLEPAENGKLDRVYTFLLDQLCLDLRHWEALRGRGFTREAVQRMRFRTLPLSTRDLLAARVAERFPFWEQVPGFYERSGRPHLGGVSGLLIPCCNLSGQVTSLRVRPDDPGEGGKYRWLSSADFGGPGPTGRASYWPAPNKTRIRVTEGELKAARLAEGTGIPTISAPGVAEMAGTEILAWLRQLAPETILFCPDRDFRTNPQVGRAVRGALSSLNKLQVPVKVEVW